MAPKAKKHREDLLDEALDESFPASDPPSMTEPTVSIRQRTRRGVQAQKPAKAKKKVAKKKVAKKSGAKRKAAPKRAKKAKKRRS